MTIFLIILLTILLYKKHFIELINDHKKYIGDYGQSTFEDYVLNIQKNMPGALHEPRGTQHLQHQHKYLCIDRENTLDFVGRYENLENDWSYICNTLFKNTVNIRGETNNVGSLEAAATHGTEELLRRLPIKNQSANNYLKYYSPQMIQVVNEVYAQDFEIFEYEIEKQ